MNKAADQSIAYNPDEFRTAVQSAIDQFPRARLLQRVDEGRVSLNHYHAILETVFHQTYSGPYTFARAGVNCSWQHEVAKEYLIRHAEEERTHWRWVLNDLAATGFSGSSPRDRPPHPSTQAFIGLQYYMAQEFPIGRLAIASVLEGIGAHLGGPYGAKMLGLLGLKPSQASFFLSHSQTDVVHIAELSEVLDSLVLTGSEWQWMTHAAKCAGQLYRDMYDHDAFI